LRIVAEPFPVPAVAFPVEALSTVKDVFATPSGLRASMLARLEIEPLSMAAWVKS
jgi:hypothetical protein